MNFALDSSPLNQYPKYSSIYADTNMRVPEASPQRLDNYGGLFFYDRQMSHEEKMIKEMEIDAVDVLAHTECTVPLSGDIFDDGDVDECVSDYATAVKSTYALRNKCIIKKSELPTPLLSEVTEMSTVRKVVKKLRHSEQAKKEVADSDYTASSEVEQSKKSTKFKNKEASRRSRQRKADLIATLKQTVNNQASEIAALRALLGE